ncbi:hypothetical protein SN811_02990 [Ligilactobacillus agilis]|uniref:Uncharacterized protein n=1 Tax=Ligilactobacillus agilis TaxID=1601 RepID=A0A6F9Y2Q3_9LACO|nr:hypothetical protein SN811_02990 [Ligilactobacillus agilis]
MGYTLHGRFTVTKIEGARSIGGHIERDPHGWYRPFGRNGRTVRTDRSFDRTMLKITEEKSNFVFKKINWRYVT